MNFHCQLENDHRIVRFLKGLYIDTRSVFSLNGFILKKSKPWNSSLFAPVVKSCRQDYIENHNESSAQDFQKRLLDSEIPISLQDIRCLGWAMDGARGVLLWGRLRGYLWKISWYVCGGQCETSPGWNHPVTQGIGANHCKPWWVGFIS